jgi:prophage DNA circulation protein
MVELHVQAVKSLKKAPYRFAFDLGKSIAALKQNVAEFADELTFAGAMRGATEIAKIYDADEVARETVRAIEQQSMFDGDGRIIEREAAPAIATIVEIERSLAHTRERLHECVVIDRSMRSPQAAAHALLEHVKRIKLELERVVEIYEPHPMPLHVICVKHDLSYAVAERILSLNPQIQNPTFCQGTIKIYER